MESSYPNPMNHRYHHHRRTSNLSPVPIIKPPSSRHSRELFTKSKAFLQDTLTTNSSSMKPPPNNLNKNTSDHHHHHHHQHHHHHNTTTSSSSTSSPPSSNCNFLKAFSRCFTLCSKPKDYSEYNNRGTEMDENSTKVELNEPSEILKPNEVNLLGQQLPPIAIGNTWRLTFSTSIDGFCLHSLYRKMNYVKNESPILLIIQDTQDRVFGVLASNALRISENFYGSCTSFLFRFNPSLQVYKWNGDNFYFIKGDLDSIMFGSGNGKSGLWLDGDLNKGRTEACATFGSPPLVDGADGYFTIRILECWSFVKTKPRIVSVAIPGKEVETDWLSRFSSVPSLTLTTMNKHEEIEEASVERKDSLTSKTTAEQEIVNQYVINLTDELKSALHSQGSGEFRPELIIGRSEILDFDDVVNIGKNFSETCPWFITYSTLLNDTSLEILYSKAEHIVGPTLLVIKDYEKRVFGVLLSDPPRLSGGYYGTGQSFLFQCRPKFQIYRWTGKDHCFVHGRQDSLVIGGNDENGNCAIRLNAKLTEGKTVECATYGNQPLVPDPLGMFKIKILECWHFGSPTE